MTEYSKYFTTTKKGGYSTCLDRGGGCTLPNCVGWAWGNFYYFHGQKHNMYRRPQGNANQIYSECRKEGSGFWVSKVLKENSIACFNIGEYGHVMYVHFKMPNGQWLCSESNYSGTVKNGRFVRYIITTNPAAYYKNYQGCVYDFTD